MLQKHYYVYILTNYTNSVFYTGITNNLERRVNEHRKGINKDSFTSRYRIYKLVWYDEWFSPVEAIDMEKKIKDMRRAKKLSLIKGKNPNLQNLLTFR